MAGNTFGKIFRVTTFGESHGAAIGAVVDGCPAGLRLCEDDIQKQLDRRKPSASLGASATKRREPDKVRILSGVFEGATEGTPIAMLIENTSQHSSDYGNLVDTFRPGHGDFTYFSKYGVRDYRGGGRASGRETASRVAAGAVAQKFLETCGIHITAYTTRAAGISCEGRDLSIIEKNTLRACDMKAAEKMEEHIAELRKQGESTGGIVECVISGCPAGLGEPVFDKIDAELAKAMLSIGAVKGIEFGAGFAVADMTGSENNDEMRVKVSANNDASASAGGARSDPPVGECSSTSESTSASASLSFLSNNAGGTLAGISSGQDIVFRVAIKPVPSIFKTQQTVRATADGTFENAELAIKGRHDVCLCPRIVPVVEAMSALVVADMMLRARSAKA